MNNKASTVEEAAEAATIALLNKVAVEENAENAANFAAAANGVMSVYVLAQHQAGGSHTASVGGMN
jgi:hypothetical protein